MLLRSKLNFGFRLTNFSFSWSGDNLKNISIFTRFMAAKPGRVLTSGRRFSMQMLKSWLTCFISFKINYFSVRQKYGLKYWNGAWRGQSFYIGEDISVTRKGNSRGFISIDYSWDRNTVLRSMMVSLTSWV